MQARGPGRFPLTLLLGSVLLGSLSPVAARELTSRQRLQGLGNEARFLPSDPDVVLSINVQSISERALFPHFVQEVPELEESTRKLLGVPLADVARITVGGSLPNGEAIFIVVLKRPLELEALLNSKSHGGRPVVVEEVGDDLLLTSRFGPAFSLVDEQTVVLGEKESVRKILTRDGPPQTRPAFQAAVRDVDFAEPVALAFDLSRMREHGANLLFPLRGDTYEAGVKLLGQVRIADRFEARLGVVCRDEASAKSLYAACRGFLAEAQQKAESSRDPGGRLLRGAELTLHGSRVGLKLTADPETVFDWLNPGRTRDR